VLLVSTILFTEPLLAAACITLMVPAHGEDLAAKSLGYNPDLLPVETVLLGLSFATTRLGTDELGYTSCPSERTRTHL